MPKKRIALFQRMLPHYRIGVFEALSQSRNFDYVFFFGENLGSFPDIDPDKIPFTLHTSPAVNVSPSSAVGGLYFQPNMFRSVIGRNFDAMIIPSDFHDLFFLPVSSLSAVTGVKVVHFGHGLSLNELKSPWRWRLRRMSIELADAIILYGQREYDEYMQRGVDMEKIFIANNTLDTKRIKQIIEKISADDLDDFRRRNGLVGKRIIIFSGRLQTRKRLDLAVRAMPKILKEIPDVKFIIIGDGPARTGLETLVSDMGLGDSVVMPGAIFDEKILAMYFRCSQLSLCPGAAGLMINQSFTYGIPVLTSDKLWNHGPEIAMVRPGKTGDFFHDGNSGLLADKTVLLLQNQPKLADMSKNCIKSIDEKYSVQHFAKVFDAAVEFAMKH